MKLIQHGLAIMLMLFMSLPAWANNEGPKAVIENTVRQIIQALEAREDKNELSEKDRDTIRQIVKGRFDYTAMAKRSLGKPWKKLNDKEQAHFTEVFRELLERSYGNRLSEYKDQVVVFDDAELKKDKARVKSKVIDGTRETPVEYRLHQTNIGWQVYDIRIEGTSMIRTFNQDFKSILEKGGYDTLVKTLEEKVARLKAKNKA